MLTPRESTQWLDKVIAGTGDYRTKRVDYYKIRYNIDTISEDDDGTQFPWEDAPDHKIYYVDGNIRKKKALLTQAAEEGTIFAEPQEPGDFDDSDAAEQIYEYYRRRIPDRRRKVAITADRQEEKGAAILGVFWDSKLQGYKETLAIADFPPEVQVAFTDPVNSPLTDYDLSQYIITSNGVAEEDVLRVIGELRTNGAATFDTVEVCGNGIVWRNYILNENWFKALPEKSIQEQPAIWTLTYLTKEQLKMAVRTKGFEKTVVEEIVKRATDTEHWGEVRQEMTERWTQMGISNDVFQSWFDTKGELRGGLIPIVELYYEEDRDEDMVSEKYLMVYSPLYDEKPLSPKVVARNGNLSPAAKANDSFSYPHGGWPFVDFLREVNGEHAEESRGQPEISHSIQESIRININLMDAMGLLAVAPPLLHPLGRKLAGEFGPLQQLAYEGMDPNMYKWFSVPTNQRDPQNTLTFLDRFDRGYWGNIGRDLAMTNIGDQMAARNMRMQAVESEIQQRDDISNWLGSWSEAHRQGFKLVQAYMPEQIEVRILNNPDMPTVRRKRNDIQGEYDIFVHFDAATFDQATKEKNQNEMLQLILQTNPRNVSIDEMIKIYLMSRDKAIARKVLQPANMPIQKEYEEEMGSVTRMLTGAFDPDFENVSQAANPEARMQIWQKMLKRPDIVQKMQADLAFAGAVNKRVKQLQFQMQQKQNAMIGRRGA